MPKIKIAMISMLLCCTLVINAYAAKFKFASASDPISVDMYEQIAGPQLQMANLVFDPLVRWNRQHKIESRLAEKWETYQDKTTHFYHTRFYLRKGVKFHSGREMTAKDVIWTFNRIKRSADYKSLFIPFLKIKKIGKYKVDFISKKPYPLTLNIASYVYVMDSKFYQGTDKQGRSKGLVKKGVNTFASRHASGTGPFIVTSHQQGIKMTFKRFTNYWDKKSPGNITELTWIPIKESATRLAALLSGDVDMIFPVEPNQFKQIEKNNGLRLITLSGTRVIMLSLNEKHNAALKNKKVRLAINYAINNEGIVQKIMHGFGTPAAQLSHKSYLGYNASLKTRYDIVKAQALMKEVGYAKGKELALKMVSPNNRYPNDAKVAQAIQAMLSKIYIKVYLTTMPKAQYWPLYDKCDADVLLIGWDADTQDSSNMYEYMAMTPDETTGMGHFNCSHYSNPKADAMVNESDTILDVDKRAQLLKSAEASLYNDAGIVPLYFQNLAFAAKANVDLDPIINTLNFPYLGDLLVH